MTAGSKSIPTTSSTIGLLWWRGGAFAYFLVAAWILVCFRGTAASMVDIWIHSETFMHCFLIPPIVLWLIWRRRAELSRVPSQPDWRFLILMAGTGFCWLVGELAAVNAITQLALVLMLVLAVPTLFGSRVAGVIALPLFFLFFAVPLGEFVLPLMMEWTANFTVFALRLSGVPVYREGLQFILPTGNWSVVEACSGIRYLIASITVGTLFAYLNFHSVKRRLAFIAVAFLVPIVANWLRAYGIVMLGHLSGNTLAVGVDHIIYGWLFFGVVIMLMFAIGGRWTDAPTELPLPATDVIALPPLENRSSWSMVMAVIVVVLLPQVGNAALQHTGNEVAPRLKIEMQSGQQWRPAPNPANWRPAFQNPTSEFQGGYAGPPGTVGLYIGYYRHQGYLRKLVSSENALVKLQDPVWSRVEQGQRQITFRSQEVIAKTAQLRGASLDGSATSTRLVVWQWYWIGGQLTSSDYIAKARIALLRLFGQDDDSAVIIVYAPKEQAGGAEGVLQSFIQSAGGPIESALRRARERP